MGSTQDASPVCGTVRFRAQKRVKCLTEMQAFGSSQIYRVMLSMTGTQKQGFLIFEDTLIIIHTY